jgi:carbon monoxide dehydrogenase subunit G
MALERSFTTQLPPPAVWAWISDLDQLVGAMPGFTPTGRDGSDLTGKFVLRVGSQQVTYAGQIAVTTSDRAGGRLRLSASGAGARGSGEASAEVQIRVDGDAAGSTVTVNVEPAGKGRIETFDPDALRASGDRLLDRFLAAIEERLPVAESASEPVAESAPEPVAVEPDPAPAVRSITREPTERLATVTSISDVVRDRSRARRSAAASAVAMVAAMIALWLVHRRNAH